jgi:hypothetical protein
VVNLIILISKNGEKFIKNQNQNIFLFTFSKKKQKQNKKQIAKTNSLLTRHSGQVF